jgi:short-subunit dehydrogenase
VSDLPAGASDRRLRPLALITGASAGIGEAFARLYAAKGHDLALTARRGDRLAALGTELAERFGIEAICIVADLADPAATDAVLDVLAQRGRVVDVLVNNAGYGLPGVYANTSWADQQAFLQVLVTAPCALAHAVLPGMLSRGHGRILNVASLAGLVPGAAGHTLYGAAKGFMVRFSQSLHQEALGSGVHVTALCPGLTWSEFHDVVGNRKDVNETTPSWMWSSAEAVAQAGYAAVEANRAVSLPGWPNKLIAGLTRLIPDGVTMALMERVGPKIRKR